MGGIFTRQIPDNNVNGNNDSNQQVQPDNSLNNRDIQLYNAIFTNNNFPESEHVQVVVNTQTTKKTKTYKCPIMLKRTDIKLEKDGLEHDIYYICFKYTSVQPFSCSIYFNATQNDASSQGDGEESFIPSSDFKNLTVKINQLDSGNDASFLEKSAYLDIKFLNDKKTFDRQYYDFILEMIVRKASGALECKLATMCKIIPITVGNSITYRAKVESQKLFVRNIWLEMHDIYGLDSENSSNECEACYSHKKNTIFLPCMHSYACQECWVNVRLRGNKCPLCRHNINDALIIDDKRSSDNGNVENSLRR